MSSSRYSRSNRAALLAAACLSALAGAASAQEATLPPAGMPGMTQDGFAPAPAAPSVALPEGASVGDSAERVRDLAAEAGRDLDALVGGAVTPESEAEQRASAARTREIIVLRDRLEQAKLAKELYEVLNGESNEADERVAALEAEKAELERRLSESASAPAAQQAAEPLPVVSRVSGSGADMTANILVPYVGEVRATVGSVLPDGRRVVSVSQSGVVTVKGGARDALPFGTSVPSQRPAAPQAQPVMGGAPIAFR